MKKYVALLRGINVSGQKKIKMVELKSALSDAGLSAVTTYIQSGNVVFESNDEPLVLQGLIERVILDVFGFEVPTLILLHSELANIIADNPFLSTIEDIKKLYVCFLFGEPTKDRIKVLQEAELRGDEYILDSRGVLYTCYHNGMGNTKMDNNFLENKLKVKATTRNWRTVNVLFEM